MKKLIALIATLAFSSCTLAPAADTAPKKNADGSLTLVLPTEVVDACEKEGGCRIVSRAQLLEWAKQLVAKQCGKEI